MNNKWYRNKVWDEQTASEFEIRFKKSRSAVSKAQYLRIQALYLLESENYGSHGEQLMLRLFADFPGELLTNSLGHVELGDYYRGTGRLQEAAEEYRIAIKLYEQMPVKTHDTLYIFIKLADIYLLMEDSGKYHEIYSIISGSINQRSCAMMLNNEKYFMHLILARLTAKLGKYNEAAQNARNALKISEINTPQFRRHRNTGIVRASSEEIEELHTLLKHSGN